MNTGAWSIIRLGEGMEFPKIAAVASKRFSVPFASPARFPGRIAFAGLARRIFHGVEQLCPPAACKIQRAPRTPVCSLKFIDSGSNRSEAGVSLPERIHGELR